MKNVIFHVPENEIDTTVAISESEQLIEEDFLLTCYESELDEIRKL